MPKFKVSLVQSVYEEASVEVEAQNEEEAERRAVEMAYSDGVIWSFLESNGDACAVCVEMKEEG